jgi:TolA-binding protein
VDAKKLVVALLLFTSLAAAQSTDPALSPENHARIRDIQHKIDTMIIQSQNLQRQQEELQKQYTIANQELENAITKAMTDAKADGKTWMIDRESLTLKRIPAPPQAEKPATPPKNNP